MNTVLFEYRPLRDRLTYTGFLLTAPVMTVLLLALLAWWCSAMRWWKVCEFMPG